MSSSITNYGTKTDYWSHSDEKGYDFTRGSKDVQTKSILTQKGLIKFVASKSALVVIDMQNFFLHPEIRTHAPGLLAFEQLKLAIPAAKAAGMEIIYCNWGLTDEDVSTMSGAHASSFGAMLRSSEGLRTAGFGHEMGTVAGVDAGRLLFRDQWNSALYGELQTMYEEGAKDGSAIWIHKNRMSSMWGEKSLMSEYLEKKGIKTLFYSGVNTDQCVWGSQIDSHNKGYDTILIKDCSGTNSPDACRIATEYNAELIAFSTSTYNFVTGLK